MGGGDAIGRLETFGSAEVVLDLFLLAMAAVKFLGVGVVPPREAELGGGAVVRGGDLWRENWEVD